MEGHKVSLDRILVEELGQFGRYQLVMLGLVALPTFFSAFGTGEYVFTTARIPSRCLIPECDDAIPEFAAPWRNVAIPRAAGGGYEQCARFAHNASRRAAGADHTCSAALFDASASEPCDQYVYQNDLTIVYDFNLACNEWQRSLVGSMRVLGTLFALPLTGYISDRWGRRVALAITAFNTSWLGIARSFATTYKWFGALMILEATFGSGCYSCCYILSPKRRVLVGTILTTMLSLGQAVLGSIAWSVPHWRTLTQVLFIPQLVFISYFWLISESIRWLMISGRYAEAEKILKRIAASNKRTLSEKSLKGLQASAELERSTRQLKEPWLPILVFRSPLILKRCCIIPVWWITNMLIFYGIRLNAVNLSGNSYLNYSLVVLIEIPGRWTAFLLLDRIGRKPVIIIAYLVCSTCQFIFAFLPEGMEDLALLAYLIGKFCIAAIAMSVQLYTMELYPTKYRHNLFAFSSMLGRIGGMMAPLTPALAQEVWKPLPPVLFGSLALASALLVLTTPETLGLRLPETMQDAENIGKSETPI